jgi:hypothetical protein
MVQHHLLQSLWMDFTANENFSNAQPLGAVQAHSRTAGGNNVTVSFGFAEPVETHQCETASSVAGDEG